MTVKHHDCGIVSHVGKVRKANEDSVLVSPVADLWVLADGVGGSSFGQVASQLTTQTVERRVRQGERLDDAIREAHSAVQKIGASSEEYKGMATTVVACQLKPEGDGSYQLNWSWVGDSRLYLIEEHALVQLSDDHNMARELAARGDITPEEISNHSSRHVLTQAVGATKLKEVPMKQQQIMSGQGFLLCSDGLSGVLSDKQILDHLQQSESAQAACDAMLKSVLARGAPDNVSIIVVYPHYESANSDLVSDSAPELAELATKDDSENITAEHVAEAIESVGQVPEESYRRPCDKSKYLSHRRGRKWLLLIVLVSIVALLVLL